MDLEEWTKEKLWNLLVETVHTSVMYPSRKAYIRDNVIREKPEVTSSELAVRFNMSLGEAIVILEELKAETKSVP